MENKVPKIMWPSELALLRYRSVGPEAILERPMIRTRTPNQYRETLERLMGYLVQRGCGVPRNSFEYVDIVDEYYELEELYHALCEKHGFEVRYYDSLPAPIQRNGSGKTIFLQHLPGI